MRPSSGEHVLLKQMDQVWKRHADQLLSQSGSNYQPPDAHVPTEMDGGLSFLADFPGSAQSAVEQAAPDNATHSPMEGPEVTSAEQGHCGTDPLTTEPEAQASPQLLQPVTHPPAKTKTYPRRDRHPCVRYVLERTNS